MLNCLLLCLSCGYPPRFILELRKVKVEVMEVQNTQQEFTITRGMLAQFKLGNHGWWYENKPQNVFEQCYGRLPGFASITPLGFVAQDDILKYILHVVDVFTIYHPKFPNIKTRYLKCFITIPSKEQFIETPKGKYVLPAIESETKLGYVRAEWVEPLEETEYTEVIRKNSRAIIENFLQKINAPKF